MVVTFAILICFHIWHVEDPCLHEISAFELFTCCLAWFLLLMSIFVTTKTKVTRGVKLFLLPWLLSSTLNNLWESPVKFQQCAAFLLTIWSPWNIEASLEWYIRTRPFICHPIFKGLWFGARIFVDRKSCSTDHSQKLIYISLIGLKLVIHIIVPNFNSLVFQWKKWLWLFLLTILHNKCASLNFLSGVTLGWVLLYIYIFFLHIYIYFFFFRSVI